MKLKRIFISCAAVTLCAAAYAVSLPVGYCLGSISKTGISKVGNARVSGAIVLPEEMLSPYSGALVTGVRVGLVTAEGVEDLSVWVRSSVEGEDIDSATVEAPCAGWNEGFLEGGLVVDGDPLAVGFSFSQVKSVKCISLVGEDRADGKWIAKNGVWEESKSTGVLSIELMLASDDLPSTNLSLLSLVPDAMPVPYGENMDFTVNVVNKALVPTDGFSVDCYVDGEKISSQHIDEFTEYGKIFPVCISIESDAFPSDVPLSLEAVVRCDEDEDLSDNSVGTVIGSYTKSIRRKVLVEEFTTEQCPNCPRAINTLKQCENAGYGEDMTVVAHHVGFYTDWLTLESDKEYLWFYDPTGAEGTYAPAVMLDRRMLDGESVPVNSIGYFQDFEPMLQAAIAVPAFASVSVDADAEGDVLAIDVDMERLPLLEVTGAAPRLTVYVVEDGIVHHAQAGISSDSFTHSHVNRLCVTDIWGDNLDWEEDKAEAHYQVSIDPEWNLENLNVVAFLHEYDGDNVAACKVFNSAGKSLAVSAVKMIDAAASIDRNAPAEVYTPSGIKVADSVIDLPAGIYIVRQAGKTAKITVK